LYYGESIGVRNISDRTGLVVFQAVRASALIKTRSQPNIRHRFAPNCRKMLIAVVAKLH
jgi:hypothetical protein